MLLSRYWHVKAAYIPFGTHLLPRINNRVGILAAAFLLFILIITDVPVHISTDVSQSDTLFDEFHNGWVLHTRIGRQHTLELYPSAFHGESR